MRFKTAIIFTVACILIQLGLILADELGLLPMGFCKSSRAIRAVLRDGSLVFFLIVLYYKFVRKEDSKTSET